MEELDGGAYSPQHHARRQRACGDETVTNIPLWLSNTLTNVDISLLRSLSLAPTYEVPPTADGQCHFAEVRVRGAIISRLRVRG